MIRLAIAAIFNRKLRTLLTAAAVLLGVAMISGTYVFTDTIDAAFEQVFENANEGADAVVSGKEAFTSNLSTPSSLPAGLVEKVSAVPGAAKAEGQIIDFANILGNDGRPVNKGGAPPLAYSATGAPFHTITVVKGVMPDGLKQVAIDQGTVKKEHFRIGQQIAISTQLPKRKYRLTGVIKYGNSASLGGATVAVFDLPTAQRIFNKKGKVDVIFVAAKPGVSAKELVKRVEAVVPQAAQVKTATDQAESQSKKITDALSIITVALLVFGFIAIFVGAFIIFNTFSITVAQRVREFALLRTLGAMRRQILGSVVFEAFVIGVLASIGGLFTGLLFAGLIEDLFKVVNVELPATSLILKLRTVVVCLAVGTGVTLLAALIPALRATRVAPMEALREGVELSPSRFGRFVPFIAVVVGTLGLVAMIIGLLTDSGSTTDKLVLSAGGAIALIIGVAIFSPRLVPPLSLVISWPALRLTGMVGQIARANTARNPARTAITATALMVGLGLVMFVTIFANGLRASTDKIISDAFASDFIVSNRDGFSPIPITIATAVQGTKGVKTVAQFKAARAKVKGVGERSVSGVQQQSINQVYKFKWAKGSNKTITQLGSNEILMEKKEFISDKLRLGEKVTLLAPNGSSKQFTIAGVYDDPAFFNGFMVPLNSFNQLFGKQRLIFALVQLAPGVNLQQGEQAVNRTLKAFPEAEVLSQQQLKNRQTAKINQLLALFSALLVLSIIVALFGLVNTLTLSIYERTRELGMLRAIGMTRRQVRRMVRYESIITAEIGGLLGLVLGVFLAWIVTRAVSTQGLIFAVPWGQIIVLLLLAFFAGVVAAVLPARRASRLNILEAIAYE